ncbi:MAG: ISAs1 family transposase [Moorea sp. SIO2I5]|nr:ISAs1 family transposase [Moorena sp. SIO2I5]
MALSEPLKKHWKNALGKSQTRESNICVDTCLNDIIAIALLAVLASAEGWEDIEIYGQGKQEWLGTFLELANGIPSHDKFARVFTALDPQANEEGFQTWVAMLAQARLGTSGCHRWENLKTIL